MNDNKKVVKYGRKDRYSIKIQNNNDGDKEENNSIYENEIITILSCVNRWPEFKIKVGIDHSAFDRPHVAIEIFLQRMEAMKLYNSKNNIHTYGWRDLLQDGEEEKSTTTDTKDTSSLVKLKRRKICSMDSFSRLLKFVKFNN